MDSIDQYEYAFICPNCYEEIQVEEKFLGQTKEFPCPKCGETIFVGLDLDQLKF